MLSKLNNFLHNKNINIKKMKKLVQEINFLEKEYSVLNDNELRDKLYFLKKQYDHGRLKNKDKIINHVFAIVREASKRVFGMRQYDVQLLGGLYLNEGYISEMQTGEGKTLVATAPAVYNALIGNKVHIVTINDYLAERDFLQMSKLYGFLGLSTGLIVSRLTREQRKESYSCNIVYGTNNEFGFDYLKDNLIGELEEPIQKGLDYVIIDEVDSVLIDEARTPLIISEQVDDNSLIYIQMIQAISCFKENTDYTRDKENKKMLISTENGILKVEKYFNIDSLYSEENAMLLNVFEQSLKALFVFEKDKDYIVKNNEVVIVDEFTGRLMAGRRYSDGLHQALEAKEGVELKQESKTIATITFQNFFRLYAKKSGMTGTAKTEETEFYNIYGLPVVQIPKNKPNKRIDYPDLIFKSKEAKYIAVVNKIKDCFKKKQPILVGTTSIADSEHISELLKIEGLNHTVLNAKFDEDEANIISMAGKLGSITIATNMAGRGTDIIPDELVENAGGLFILGTEKHESRRIDNQLRGRTARQGSLGETQFYLSLEDDLFKYFGGEKLLRFFSTMQINLDNTPIQSNYLTRAIDKCQKKVELKNFNIRKHLLNYDDVLNTQRIIIYKQRNDIKFLNYKEMKKNLLLFIKEILKKEILDVYAPEIQYPEDWDLIGLLKKINQLFSIKELIVLNEIVGLTKKELDDFVFKRTESIIEFKENLLGEDVLNSILKTALLKTTDNLWQEQINNMTFLKEGINLRAYGQQNPLIEYKKEAFLLFEEMKDKIKHQFVQFSLDFEIQFSENN